MKQVLRLIGLTGDRWRFARLVLASSLTGVFDLIGIGLILPLVTIILAPDNPTILELLHRFLGITEVSRSLVIEIGLVLFAIFILKNVITVCTLRSIYRFASQGSVKIIRRLLFLYFRAPLEYYADRNSVTFTRSLREFAPRAYDDGVLGLCGMLGEGASFIMLVGLLFLVAPLGMTLAGTLLFGLLVMNHLVLGRRMVRWARVAAETYRASQKQLAQIFPAIKEIRTLGRTNHYADEVKGILRNESDLRRKQLLAGQMSRPVIETFMLLAILVVLATLLSGNRTVVEVLPTISVFAAATIRLLPLVNRLSQFYNRFTAAKVAVNAVIEDLEHAGQLKSLAAPAFGTGTPAFTRSLDLRDVSYSYPSASRAALNGVSLSLTKGEIVGLVGPSGSGKSTLADTILGLIKPISGELLADAQMETRPVAATGAAVAYVPQETVIFDDSLKHNIALGLDDSEIDDAKIREALRRARLDDLLSHLEGGVDAPLGERGHKLSGGQRQRVGIARALYDLPDLLVLDEVTSGLDGRTEREVTESILGLKGRTTVVVISHRIHTLKACDRIYFLKDGRITAEGDYETLLQTCPDFADLALLADTRSEASAGIWTNTDIQV